MSKSRMSRPKEVTFTVFQVWPPFRVRKRGQGEQELRLKPVLQRRGSEWSVPGPRNPAEKGKIECASSFQILAPSVDLKMAGPCEVKQPMSKELSFCTHGKIGQGQIRDTHRAVLGGSGVANQGVDKSNTCTRGETPPGNKDRSSSPYQYRWWRCSSSRCATRRPC
jgi:hypothetical protein